MNDTRLSPDEARRRLELAIAATGLGVFEWEVDTDRAYMSPETACILGIEQDRGSRADFASHLHPEDREEFLKEFDRVLRSGASFQREARVLRPDGSVRWISTFAKGERDPCGTLNLVMGTVRDITSNRQLEEEFRQAQRLEAVGRLAAGVAHDFNNVLTIINSYSELLMMDPKRTPQDGEALQCIREAGGRAAALTRQLLAFSRRQVLQRRNVEVSQALGGLEKMLRRLIGEDIQLTVEASPGLPCVHIDPGQLDQAIMNLVINSRDAMPNGGRLEVRASSEELGAEFCKGRSIRPGAYVAISVTDTGCGMTPEVLARIFEPFFTTKEPGKGTGLGLATVSGIVQQAGGCIDVRSTASRGSRFTIFLAAATGTGGHEERRRAPRPAGGRGTVLVAEDELEVRRLITLVLRRRGHRVLEAGSGDEALEMLRDGHVSVDLLLTDIIMPGMNGVELARRVRETQPIGEVLYITGYLDDSIRGLMPPGDFGRILAKPFTPVDLLDRVSDLLDSRERRVA